MGVEGKTVILKKCGPLIGYNPDCMAVTWTPLHGFHFIFLHMKMISKWSIKNAFMAIFSVHLHVVPLLKDQKFKFDDKISSDLSSKHNVFF